MKKFLPYILIFIIIANFFAPFSVEVNNKNSPQIVENIAKAENTIIVRSKAESTDKSIRVYVYVLWGTNTILEKEFVEVTLKDSSGNLVEKKEVVMQDDTTLGGNNQIGEVIFTKDVKAETVYQASAMAAQGSIGIGNGVIPGFEISVSGIPTPNPIIIPTQKTGVTTFVTVGTQKSSNIDNQKMPNCSIWSPTTYFTGCLAQALYYVLFIPTSYLFALSGVFFDTTFAYSVSDASSRSTFVVEGWAVVRDLCNMFFIFILLYIAIGTILKLHNVKTKEMIINVVIIGLFINFSLFATQVIIDASNVLARVFYNADIIKITEKGANGVADATPGLVIGEDGVIPLSAAVVNKINPQNLIIHSTKVGVIEDTAGKADTDSNTTGAGTFALVTLLTVFVNIVGIITFLSLGLIFVSRIVGLWLAMIIAPLAFFTYAVPPLKDTKMIGWTKWWPDTIKLAFLAPVFIFFMYIILKFLQTGLGIFGNGERTGIAFVLATIIPFAFIMILLLKAKSIASDMSGEMGRSITGAVAAGGGMLLGGAALGTAFLGRKVVGQTLANASRGETASQQYMKTGGQGMGVFRKTVGFVGSGFGTGKGVNKIHDWAGDKLNKTQEHVNEIDHARHITDEQIEKSGFKGKTWSNLTGAQQTIVLNRVKKEEATKYMGEAEDAYREKTGNEHLAVKKPLSKKEEDDILDDEKNKIKSAKGISVVVGQDLIDAKANAAVRIDKENKNAGKLPALSKTEKEEVKKDAMGTAENKFKEEIRHAAESVGALDRAFTKANTGSWDVRNLSSSTQDKREGIFTKASTAMIAGVALGVRSGLKSSGVNHGTGQSDLLKDIGTTITEALKSIKVEVPKAPSSGGHGGGDSHGAAAGGHH